MNIKQLIRTVYGVRFLKYTGITLGVLLLCSLIGFYHHFTDLYFANRVPIFKGLGHWALSAGALMPAGLTVALCVAAFFSFRRLPRKAGIKDLFVVAGIGVLFCIVAGIGLGVYNRNVAPGLNARLSAEIYTLRQGNYPREKGEEDIVADFRNLTPRMSVQTILEEQTDSLRLVCESLRAQIAELLAALPDDIAKSSYDAYRLRDMGIGYKPSVKPADPEEQALYNDVDARLYSTSTQLFYTLEEFARHKRESHLRSTVSFALPLLFLLFACLGYSLRFKTMRVIWCAIAVIITASFLYNMVSQYTTKVVDSNVKEVRYFLNERRR